LTLTLKHRCSIVSYRYRYRHEIREGHEDGAFSNASPRHRQSALPPFLSPYLGTSSETKIELVGWA
jgi:hypothetical protein